MPSHRKSAAREVAEFLISKHPQAPARSLAKILVNEHPELFDTIEQARDMVRWIIGQRKNNKKHNPDKRLFREARKPGQMVELPEAVQQMAGDWSPFVISGENRTAVINDLHIRFHAAPELSLALDHIDKWKPTCILLNGDIFDCHAISDHEINPELRNHKGEVKACRQFLTYIRKRFKTCRIVFKWGNHEERHVRFMRKHAPDFLGIPEFEWEEVYDVAAVDIQVVKNKRRIMLGKLNVLHGHEYRWMISNPVSPARGMMLRAKANSMVGHFHQSTSHTGRTVEDKLIGTWSVGCLCDLHPEWLPYNEWSHGFALVEHNNREFQVENFKILHQRIYHA